MALAKTKFEDPTEGGAPAAPAAAATAAPAAAATAAPAAAATAAPGTPAPAASVPAVAAKAGLPVAAGGAFKDFFKQFENAFPEMEFGTLPRLLGVNGAVFVKGNNTPDVSLGEKIEIDIHSFHDEYVISPGSDKDESKEKVRYSRDGETIDGTGQKVDAYLTQLREVDGYKDAKSKRYVHLVGTLVSAAKPTTLIGDIVDVTISPDGVKAWENHRIQRSAKISQRRATEAGSERVTITATAKSGGGKNWVALVVGPGTTPPAAEQEKQAA